MTTGAYTRAEIDSQPVLEIHADEVQAAHGATVGQLDTTALFYLRSRGVPVDQARAQLQRYGSIATQGFVSKDELAQVQTNEEVAVAALAVDQAALDGLQLQLEFTEIRAPIAFSR